MADLHFYFPGNETYTPPSPTLDIEALRRPLFLIIAAEGWTEERPPTDVAISPIVDRTGEIKYRVDAWRRHSHDPALNLLNFLVTFKPDGFDTLLVSPHHQRGEILPREWNYAEALGKYVLQATE